MLFNEDFFDMLGELDDEIITDAAVSPVVPVKRKGTIRNFLLIAAAVTIFVISGSFFRDIIKTGNMGLFETTLKSQTTVSSQQEYETQESTTENRTEEIITNAFIPPAQETTGITEQTTSAQITAEPTTDEPLLEAPPPESTTEEPPTQEMTSANISESTTFEDDSPLDSGLPPWISDFFPSMGEPSTDVTYFFFEMPLLYFYEKLPEEKVDEKEYPVKETVSGYELQNIYGTKILPDYIPAEIPSGPTLDSTPLNDVLNKEYSVFYNEDKSKIYSSQQFTFNTKNNSTLTIKVSTEEFPLYGTEERNMGSKSLINDTPVLLISGKLLTKTVLLNAYFEKNGSYFRIQQTGKNLSEEEFIKIIESTV